MQPLTKESQLFKDKKVNEKVGFGKRPSKGSFGKKRISFKPKRITNDDELAYLNWAKEQDLRCMVCGSMSFELHHLKQASSDKKVHYKVMPLCREHHTGNKFSIHGTKKDFFEVYTWESQNIIADKLYKKYKEKNYE